MYSLERGCRIKHIFYKILLYLVITLLNTTAPVSVRKEYYENPPETLLPLRDLPASIRPKKHLQIRNLLL